MTPYFAAAGMTLYHGDVLDVLREMPEESVQCVVTSPPYWGLRDYSTPGQLGLEATPDAYVANMTTVFREVRRILRPDGVAWINLGDTMLPDKNEAMIPHRVVMALQADGWICRSTIIWAKPNPMPESVTDRPTKSHEYLFLLTKSARYYYDADAVREPQTNFNISGSQHNVRAEGIKLGRKTNPNGGLSGVVAGHPAGRNKRSVWTVATQPFSDVHFAVFPPKLIEPCILAGSAPGDVVLDPFFGSGTTALVARKHGRRAIGIDINADYLDMAIKRNAQQTLWFQEAAS